MITLIIGPAGAGKSTISKLLCKYFEKCALIEVDVIRHMVKSGMVSPSEETQESEDQLRLGVDNTCSLALNYAASDFSVVIDDVVSTSDRLDMYFERLDGQALNVFLLLPDEEIVTKRDLERDKENQMLERALVLHRRFQERIKFEDRWKVIDSSNQSPEETLQVILSEME